MNFCLACENSNCRETALSCPRNHALVSSEKSHEDYRLALPGFDLRETPLRYPKDHAFVSSEKSHEDYRLALPGFDLKETALRQRFRHADCGAVPVGVLSSPPTSLWQRFRYADCGARRCRLAVSALPCWCWLAVFVWLCLAGVGCGFRLALPCLCCSCMATASLLYGNRFPPKSGQSAVASSWGECCEGDCCTAVQAGAIWLAGSRVVNVVRVGCSTPMLKF